MPTELIVWRSLCMRLRETRESVLSENRRHVMSCSWDETLWYMIYWKRRRSHVVRIY